MAREIRVAPRPGTALNGRREAFLATIRAMAGAAPVPAASDDLLSGPPAAFLAATNVGPARPGRRVRRTHESSGATAAAVRWLSLACRASPGQVVTAAALAALATYLAQDTVTVGVAEPPGATGWGSHGRPRLLCLQADPAEGLRALVERTASQLAGRGREPPGAFPPPIVILLSDGDDLLPAPRAHRPDCDLFIEVSRQGQRMAAEFDPERHEAAVIGFFLGHIEALLREGGQQPEQDLRALPLLDAGHLRQVTERHNQGATPPGAAATLTEAVGLAIECHADRPAVAGAGAAMTYQELGEATRALAERLRAVAVRPEDRIATLVSRGDPRWVVACLAILYAGAAIVPLDPDTPPARVEALLWQVGAAAVVTDARLRGRATAGPARVVDLDAPGEHAAAGLPPAGAAGPPPVIVSPHQAAYCVFTSGSTGSPNAVVVEHASVVNFAESFRKLLGLTPADRILQYASPGFDVSMQEIFPTLLAGASLWIAGDEERLSPEALSGAFRRERITVAEIPPVVMGMMDPASLPGLRIASVGGEAFAGSLVTRWSQGRRVINGYGPAEATIGVIYKDCTGEMRSPPPIGRPVGNHRAYLLGPDLRPVPFGAIGELYLAGAGLAWGYLGNPALTAERFLPCPFTGGGGRMLRTGDLARFNADGDLVFAGRRDRQVKVRGQRVELGEIEAALASSDGIRAAVVDAGPDVPAGPDGRQDAPVTLTAYLVLAEDTTPDMRRLRAELSARLPGYMLPNRFAVVPEIPVNANGKVDIAALRSVARAAPADRAAADPAAAGLTAAQERVYAGCVAPVMPSAAPVPEADFFQMGGTSLEVMRLAARAYQAFGVEVPVVEFLRRPTLATLTRLIERGRPPQSRDGPRRAGYDGGPLPETLRTVPQPLSPGQRGIWFADRLAPGAAAYNIIEAYRLRGELDPRALRESLRVLTERHEALRSRIVEHDGVPCQMVDPAPGEFRLDHRSMPGAAIEQVTDLVASLLSEPFDLTVQHPLRAVLVSMGKADHVLALIMHHIFSDGRSTEVLLEELSGLCAGFRGGAAAPLPPRPAQPAQFAAWQDARLRAGAAVRELPYWRERLAGIPLEAELPARRPRPAAQARRGSTLYFSLPPETGGRVASVGRQVGATPFMTLLAGFAALLARYGRSRDIVVGTPVSSRSRVEFDRLVSFACNMVVLRVPCRGDPTFRELLGIVRTTTLEAYAHREVPFERLVDQLAPERDPRRNPLFQVTFQAFDAPGDFLRLPGCQAEKIKVPESSCRFDLSLAVQIHRSGLLDGYLNYSTDLFGRATAQRVVDHYRTLLCEALADPDRPLSVLAMLTKAERDALLAHAHGPRVDAEASVTELVERQTARTPSAPAVSQGEDRLSYAQLNAAANRVAHLLVRHGVRRGDVVGVCMERSPALVIALLGILKAGAAYLPADPAAPQRRVAFMFGEAGAAVAVTEQGLAARLPPATHRILLDDRSLAAMPDSSPGIAAGPDDLAYVMYTSGSTGLPKGVTVPHRAIVRLVRGLPLGPIGPADTFLLLAPVAFDASTFEIWTPLAHGARLAVCPGGPVGPRELGQVLRRERVSVLWLTAQFTNLVVNTGPAELGALATLVAGGEALSAPHIGRLLRELPDLAVYNGYGPTECTTFAVMHRVQAAHTKNAAPVPIGAPIGGTTAHVLGTDLNPVPIGSVGELYLGGDGLALSYLNRPGQTAERFIPDPFGHPGGRLYRTGDLVTRLPGGELTFRGRVDDQIKLRGFRIEPGEVAAVLSGHPAVAGSFVTTRGRGIDTELVAYAQTREPCDAETLRAYLSDRLPGYMVPTSIVVVDTLPLSPNGKVDRSALPDARAAARAGNLLARGSAPAGGLQTLIAEVWAEVLGHRDIGAFDNFFRLGGNSLQATQVIARLAARLGHEAPLTTMFRHPTVAGLAAALRDAGHPSDGPPATPPAGPLGEPPPAGPLGEPPPAGPLGEPPPAGPAPLTPGQQGLWFLEQLYPGQPAYNVAFGLRLSGPLDHHALACALKRIVERHAVLRSRFLLGRDGWPVQVSEPAGCFELTIDDVPGLGEDDAIERLRRDAAQPFSLATAPLARMLLVRIAAGEHLLGVTVHHAVFDGWSLGVFLSEMGSCYQACRGAGAPPPPLPVTYDDYARTQRARGDSGALAGHIAYWRRTLAGTTPVTVPADRPRPRRRSGAGGHHQFTLLPADRAAAVERTACAHDTTMSTVLLAGFFAWLASLTGQTDIVIGYPVSGREWPAVEHLIGYFVNTLPLRVDVSGDPAFGEVLTRTRDAAAAALAHQDVPFGTLVSELSPHRDPGRTPLFQVIFSVQDRREYREHMAGLPGVRADMFDIHNGTAKFDLDVTVVWRPEGLTGVMEYSTDLIGADTARLLAERYRLVLGAALDDLSQPLSAFQSGPVREPRLSQGAGHPPEAIGRYTLREAANGSRDPGISPATDP